ncbi:MAG: hypothetical protein WAK93_07230, partial [Solirubrobacteraceae bacterium]
MLGQVLLATAVADAGRRLLGPRQRPIEPVSIDLGSYFSDEEQAKGRRFARPQMALGFARSAIELGALVLLTRRPPSLLGRS